MESESATGTDLLTNDILCETHLKVIKLSYTWTLHNFSMHREETGKKIESSTFSAVESGNVKWRLELYPNGDVLERKDFVSLFLRLAASDKGYVLAQFKLAVLDNAGRKTSVVEATRRFAVSDALGLTKFIGRDRLMTGTDCLLTHDKLVIFCEVVAFGDSVNVSSPNRLAAVNVPESHLSQDFGNLLASRRFSDVIFVVEEKEIHAHKNILAARSPVFAAMFEHEMKENEQGRVEITDCGFEVFREVVEFIYTGRAPKLNEMAEQVLVAANKYDLGRLKAMCEEVVCSKIRVENAAEVVALADMHNAVQLKAHALRFIRAHAAGIIKTDGWKTVAQEKPHLALEALCAVVAENVAPE